MQLRSTTNDESARLACYWAIESAFSRVLRQSPAWEILGREAHDTELVRSIILMAKSLSIAVTSEGIETTEQQSQLLALGCDRGQGFFFARPLPPKAFGESLWQDCRALLSEAVANTPTASDAA